jgi:hypothetical protein
VFTILIHTEKLYIKQGVEEWQNHFETAGFKNAIIAKVHQPRRRRSRF